MSTLVLNFDEEFIREIQRTTEQQGVTIENYFKQLFYRQKNPVINATFDDYVITNKDVDDFLANLENAKRQDTGKPPFWADWSKEHGDNE